MSVINTMLKDLEQREGQTLSGRYQPPQPSRWRLALIAWLLALLCVPALAYGVWHLWLDQPASVPAPTAEVAVASPVVATPVANAVESAPSHAVVTAQPVAPTVAVTSAQQTAAPVVQPATTAVASATVAVSPQHQVASVVGVASVTETSLPAQETRAPAPGASASQENGLEETLLGPDEGPQLTEAALQADDSTTTMTDEYPAEPQGSLEIAEEHLSPQQEAALDRRKGLQALTKGQLDVARDSFSRVLANDPLDHEIRERLAGLLYGDGRIPEAQQLLDEGIRLAPSRADFRLMQARLALTTGNKAAALQSLSGWEPPVSANLDYYATRAALAQELSQPGVAASSYQQLTVAQPTEPRWWLGLGIALDKQGRPLAALDAYRKALSLPLSAGSRQFVQQRIEQLE